MARSLVGGSVPCGRVRALRWMLIGEYAVAEERGRSRALQTNQPEAAEKRSRSASISAARSGRSLE